MADEITGAGESLLPNTIRKGRKMKTVKVIDEFIADWVERVTTYHLEQWEKYRELKESKSTLLRKYGMASLCIECTEDVKKAVEALKVFRQTNPMVADADGRGNDKSKEFIRNKIAKAGEFKKAKLVAQCEKKIGEIVDAKLLTFGVDGGLNGFLDGKDGRAEVRTVYAGGYNIQCLHYRVLVKKIKE